MLYNERAELILQQLQLQSTVKVNELSQLLQVSVDTVRRDLKAMEQAGLIKCLRAVPTPVWVLLMMVCLGMGPEAGVAGLCVHTTAFFTKSFAQSFESIPADTIEALEATGAGRLSIFVNAVLPAALSQIVAWAGMRLETNFSECAILGMVGAGGVGFVISNSLQGYDYGTAGVAILLVFLAAYCIERLFVRIKKKFN